MGGERERDIERNIPRSRSAVRPQLESRATPVGTRGPLSVVFLSLSLSVQLDMQEPLNPPSPPPPPASTSRIQASSAQPCVAISGNSFRMLPVHCVHSSSLSSLSICHTKPPSNPAYTCLYYLSHKPSLFSLLFFPHAHAETSFSVTFYILSYLN